MISWFEKYNKLSWFVTVTIIMLIFYISSLTFTPSAYGGFSWKPIAYHFYAFLFLAAFLLISITQGKFENRKFIFIAVIIALFYAVSDEVHQRFVPGRACSFSDFLIDSAGILFATLIYSLKFLHPKKTSSEKYNSDLYY
ncbi:MAG: VanZ family protein [Candidatus Nanoarchaeia archaeon]|nr:VanZ family protein [Candidatus Nanoarchaeia archaeon]MDD5741740.1 VanZ family protein [Candidatus Nanoarchaeia archaeon]